MSTSCCNVLLQRSNNLGVGFDLDLNLRPLKRHKRQVINISCSYLCLLKTVEIVCLVFAKFSVSTSAMMTQFPGPRKSKIAGFDASFDAVADFITFCIEAEGMLLRLACSMI